MNNDLRKIKNKYGEAMAKLCRELFPTLLETEGLLPNLLLKNFEPNHSLYLDIMENNVVYEFKNYICSQLDFENDNEIETLKTPKELLNEVGYDLYECRNEEEIQKFKKYYKKSEELCTFNGGRLDRCVVFFAVKRDADKIRREDFDKPERQDRYGTSVISIQFTRDSAHTLSIKNRYNHRVENPDSTFSNNLDNIIEGLTVSFEKEYGLVQKYKNGIFELAGYVKANDGKYYKYNYEINNIYYCPNNVIIDNYEVKRYEKEKFIVLDYFVLDLVNKKINLVDEMISDSFIDVMENIERIEIEKNNEEKILKISLKNNNHIKIILDKCNKIVKLESDDIKKIGDNFLYYNKSLNELNFSAVQEIGNYFLVSNEKLEKLTFLSLEKIENYFFSDNKSLRELVCPELREVGNCFLFLNELLYRLKCPKLEKTGNNFLVSNKSLFKIDFFNLYSVGDSFFSYNTSVKEINCPNLRETGYNFFLLNNVVKKINFPKLEKAGNNFFASNKILFEVYVPVLQETGDGFLNYNNSLIKLECPMLEKVGRKFLAENNSLQKLDCPKLGEVGYGFLKTNRSLQKINCPNLKDIGERFLLQHQIFNKDNFNDTMSKIILEHIKSKIFGYWEASQNIKKI